MNSGMNILNRFTRRKEVYKYLRNLFQERLDNLPEELKEDESEILEKLVVFTNLAQVETLRQEKKVLETLNIKVDELEKLMLNMFYSRLITFKY